MLCRTDRLPRGDYSYEVKRDGFRAIVSTEDGLRVRSRHGWDMTERLPELAKLPTGLVLDGELVAFGLDARPSFPLLSRRVLHSRDAIPVTLMIFDVLRVEGADSMCLPYAQRRALLEALDLNRMAWRTPDAFDDGDALLEATGRLGIEGVVAKRRKPQKTRGPSEPGARFFGPRRPAAHPYWPGERDWIKVKHRSYWRFGQELEAAQRVRWRHRLTA